MNKKQKKDLIRIIIASILMIGFIFLPFEGWTRFIIYLIPYFIIGYDILYKSIRGIIHRQPFDECLLMTIATIGAIVLARIQDSGDYTEAIAVMLFYQVGELFESYAVGKSRKDISNLMDIRPDYANIEDENGVLTKVSPEELEVGSIIVVKPGERIPIDGLIIEGSSTLDTSALTGESKPRDVEKGIDVNSGCINLSGVIKIKTTKDFENSTASKILELIEDASSNKSKSENFIAKFARVYTPAVVYCAIALAILPPLTQYFMGNDYEIGTWLYRALIFLVISCPCALVVSIPLSFFAGIGGASKEGVLIKGANYLETLANTKTVVFDKTGTLTKGTFEVTAIHPNKISKEEMLHLAAHVEKYSTHPIAAAIRDAFKNIDDDCQVNDIEEISGQGIICKVNGKNIAVGNSKLMDRLGVTWRNCHHLGTIIHIAIDGEYEGHIVISDKIKKTSKQAVSALKKIGIKKTVMLTGDSDEVAKNVANNLEIDEYHSELLPSDKVSEIEKFIKKQSKNDKLVFVGDGINDAPVLSRADVGIAMGAMGSDAAIEAADVVLMDDDPIKIGTAINIAKKCMSIVKQNIVFSIAIKVICLILGAVGLANMWLAIFADVGVLVLAILNAIRCMFTKNERVIAEKNT